MTVFKIIACLVGAWIVISYLSKFFIVLDELVTYFRSFISVYKFNQLENRKLMQSRNDLLRNQNKLLERLIDKNESI